MEFVGKLGLELGTTAQAQLVVDGFASGDSSVETALAGGMADTMPNVSAKQIDITGVAFPARRLHSHSQRASSRRLAGADIVINYKITVPADSAAADAMHEDTLVVAEDALVIGINNAMTLVPSLAAIQVQQITASQLSSRLVMTDGGTLTTTATVPPTLSAAPEGAQMVRGGIIVGISVAFFVLSCCFGGFCWCYAKRQKDVNNGNDGLAREVGVAVITPSDANEGACYNLTGEFSLEHGTVTGARTFTFRQTGASGECVGQWNYTVFGKTVTIAESGVKGTIHGSPGVYRIVWSNGTTYLQEPFGELHSDEDDLCCTDVVVGGSSQVRQFNV